MKCNLCKKNEIKERKDICNSCYAKKWRRNNPNKIKLYLERKKDHIKKWNEDYNKNNPETVRKWRRGWSKRNPEKRKAQNTADYFIKIPDGHLCEICKKNIAIERHHPNYDKPLEVMFLCISCHKKLHIIKRRKKIDGFLGVSEK